MTSVSEASQLSVEEEEQAGRHGHHALHPARSTADDARLRLMVEAHFDCIWRALLRLGVPASYADDAAQQVCIVAARRLGAIRVGEERQYLLGVTLKVASDARRACGRRREVPLEETHALANEGAGAVDALVDEKRIRERLQQILDALPAEQRDAFVLFELEELTAPQVAALLDIRVGTVASRVRLARKAIRRALKPARGRHE